MEASHGRGALKRLWFNVQQAGVVGFKPLNLGLNAGCPATRGTIQQKPRTVSPGTAYKGHRHPYGEAPSPTGLVLKGPHRQAPAFRSNFPCITLPAATAVNHYELLRMS